MNFLAHLYLARQSEDAMLGAVIGDFVKGDYAGLYNPVIETEIFVHRKIDSYTDSHPVIRAAKHWFEPPRRRFAGIILDVFYDHMLIRRWADYSDVPLADFIQQFYVSLAAHKATLPPDLARIAPWMIEKDWLGSYHALAGVELAVERMSTRLSRQGDVMRDGLLDLKANYDAIAPGFDVLFPELIRFVEEIRASRSSPS